LSPIKTFTERKRDHFVYTYEEQIIMFETAVQEKRTLLWGIILGVVALAGLLGAGYALIA